MKVHLNHIAYLVTDLEKARHFYGTILGFQEINRPPFFIKGIWYDLGDFELHLMLYQESAHPQVHPLNETVQPHFAISISTKEIKLLLEKLKAAGIPLIAEPENSPSGVLQLFFYDFDKNMIEINDLSIADQERRR